MEKLLKRAEEIIQGRMKKTGFIDDSDNVDRALEEIAKKLAEEQVEEKDNLNIISADDFSDYLLDEIKNNIMCKYKKISTLKNGDYEGYYYEVDKEFETMKEFYTHFNLGE